MHRRTIHRAFRQSVIFLIQGPLMPWWGFPLGLIVGLITFMLWNDARNGALFGFAMLGLASALLNTLWILTRRWQYLYYQSVARMILYTKCPGCAYPFDGISPDRCPECGTIQAEFIDRARRIAVEYPAPSRKNDTQ